MSLLECICYIGLSALFSLVLFSWWVRGQEQMMMLERMAQQAIAMRLISHVCTRDFSQAQADSSLWNSSEKMLWFPIRTTALAYELKNDVLLRKVRAGHDKKASSAVIARDVERIEWTMQRRGGQVYAVRATITFNYQHRVYAETFLVRCGVRA